MQAYAHIHVHTRWCVGTRTSAPWELGRRHRAENGQNASFSEHPRYAMIFLSQNLISNINKLKAFKIPIFDKR